MTASIDLEAIDNLLRKEKGTLDQLSRQFFDICKDSVGVFNGCSYLANYITNDKIQNAPRFIATFILLASYKQFPSENNPFAWTILESSKSTFEPLEKAMIAQAFLRGNINKYSDFDMEKFGVIIDESQAELQEQKQIQLARDKISSKFKEIQSFTKLSPNLVEEKQTEDIQFLRPIPEFLKISNSQFHWLSPGIISDIEWDNTADIQKKLDKVRKIFFSSLDRTLQIQERSQILGLIQSDPYCPLQIGFKRQYLRSLVTHNPYLASALVTKIAKTPMVCDYLEQFLKLPTTVQIFDSLCRITKDVGLPKNYIIFFCQHHIKKIIKSKEEMEDKKSVAATMGAFLQCMFVNEIFSAFQIKKSLLDFMNYFDKVIDFAHIKIILEQSQN